MHMPIPDLILAGNRFQSRDARSNLLWNVPAVRTGRIQAGFTQAMPSQSQYHVCSKLFQILLKSANSFPLEISASARSVFLERCSPWQSRDTSIPPSSICSSLPQCRDTRQIASHGPASSFRPSPTTYSSPQACSIIRAVSSRPIMPLR